MSNPLELDLTVLLRSYFSAMASRRYKPSNPMIRPTRLLAVAPFTVVNDFFLGNCSLYCVAVDK